MRHVLFDQETTNKDSDIIITKIIVRDSIDIIIIGTITVAIKVRNISGGAWKTLGTYTSTPPEPLQITGNVEELTAETSAQAGGNATVVASLNR